MEQASVTSVCLICWDNKRGHITMKEEVIPTIIGGLYDKGDKE